MGIPVGEMDYLQADNEMKTFARLTGGRAYFPRFQAELPEIFHESSAIFATSTTWRTTRPTRSWMALTAN